MAWEGLLDTDAFKRRSLTLAVCLQMDPTVDDEREEEDKKKVC